MQHKFIEGLNGMDWKLLRKQKRILSSIKTSTAREQEAIEGILCLIDWVQDSAEQLGYRPFPAKRSK